MKPLKNDQRELQLTNIVPGNVKRETRGSDSTVISVLTEDGIEYFFLCLTKGSWLPVKGNLQSIANQMKQPFVHVYPQL